MGLIDRISTGITKLSEKAGQAIDEGRLRLDLQRERRRKDNAARDLGYLVYRQSQGATVSDGETDSLKRKITDAEAAVARIEDEIRTVRAGKTPGQETGAAPGSGPQPPAQSPTQ